MSNNFPSNFERHDVFGRFQFFSGDLPPELDRSARENFTALWELHPAASNEILIHGRMVPIPRWQQAYGRDYQFSGTVNQALPVPEFLRRPENPYSAGTYPLDRRFSVGDEATYVGFEEGSEENRRFTRRVTKVDASASSCW